MTLEIGHQLQQGRYQIRALLGRGGMGTVYLATDRNLSGRQVAIKENVDTAPSTQDQFQHEAILLSRLTHANLPRVTDHFIEPSGRQYLVMDYVEGDDLRTLLHANQGPLAEEAVLIWLDQVFDALSYMHSWIDPLTRKPTPIIHRDIKPGNIKQTPNGRIVLVDFGVAKIDETTEATVVGAKAITPGYSPLEQYTGGTDARSDIYALGATLYMLLTGQRPPDAMARVSGTKLVPPRQCNPQISQAMEQCILRALALAAPERFQSIAEMRAAIPRRQTAVAFEPLAPPISRTSPASPAGRQSANKQPAVKQPTSANRSRWTYWSTVGALLILVMLIVALVAVPNSWLATWRPLAITTIAQTVTPLQQSGGAGNAAALSAPLPAQRTVVITTTAGVALPIAPTATLTVTAALVTEAPVTPTLLTAPTTAETATVVSATTASTLPEPTLVGAALPVTATVVTETATETSTAIPTATPTAPPTNTASPIPPPTATALPTTTPTASPTATPLPTASPTTSPTTSPTLLPSLTATPVPSPTPSATPSPTPLPSPTASSTPTLIAAGDTLVHPVDGARYRFVPAGPFPMGSTINGDELPVHLVELDSFWLQETEVTNQQYSRCVAAGECTVPHNDFWQDATFAEHPVTHIDWAQAMVYAAWVGGRLPTEAEWEKAARSDDERIFPWLGEATDDDLLNFNAQSTVAVGSFPAGASPYGLLDMAGNVEEWVNDWYSPTYYAESPPANPPGPSNGFFRVVRGGSFVSNRGMVRTTARGRAVPDSTFPTVGFRVLLPTITE